MTGHLPPHLSTDSDPKGDVIDESVQTMSYEK